MSKGHMKVDKVECYRVEKEGIEYYRFGPESWMEAMDESLEGVYDCDDLEREFLTCLES